MVRMGTPRAGRWCASAETIEVRAPRVNDKRVDEETGERRRFKSSVLPPYAPLAKGLGGLAAVVPARALDRGLRAGLRMAPINATSTGSPLLGYSLIEAMAGPMAGTSLSKTVNCAHAQVPGSFACLTVKRPEKISRVAASLGHNVPIETPYSLAKLEPVHNAG